DMDEKSRQMIESMLAEEEFYSGRPSKMPSTPNARLNAISSVDLPSHNTRWTTEEDDRLREGIRLHGYGNWKAIAAVVATRNPLQVKNHARHLAASDRVRQRSFKPLLKDTQFHLQQQHQQQLQKGGTLSHISLDKMVNSPKERRTVSFGAVHVAELQPDINSYDEDEMHSSEDRHRINTKRTLSNQESDEDGYEEEEGSLGSGPRKVPHPAGILSLSRKGQKGLSKPRSSSGLSISHAQGGNSGNSASLQQYPHGQLSVTPAMTMNSTAMVLPTTPPNVTPRILDKSIITDEETRVHSEFFCNKASKTPERYQRIRNTIIQAWEKSPSTYLTKTSVRSALKDCGDVNAIGRVHSWLESIGVINVGMTASSPGASLARPRNGGNNSNPTVFNELDDMDSVWVTPPLRRRRVRNEHGEWVNESDLEGHVIEHNVHNTKEEKRYSSSRKTDRQAYFDEDGASGSLSGGSQYDPFRLVPLRKYNVQNQAPFRVKVSSDAMLIMDFHSHLAETEVIGLLGGLYDEDEKILFILGVFPCRSISTGLQCEMDPESDVEARFFFSSKGFVVVGWYHSHPTFEPNPSIRDIENQSEHQSMFRRHELNVEPFVGVIVSPFDPRNLSFLSKFQFLSVSEQVDARLNCRQPFAYDREITRTNELSVSVFQQLSDLVRYYRTYEHRVDLSLPLRRGESTTSRLEKMLKSISHHIFVDETNAKAFLSKVRELVIRGFQLDLPLHAAGSSSSAQSTTSISTSTASATLAGPPLRPTTPTAAPAGTGTGAGAGAAQPSHTTSSHPPISVNVEVSQAKITTAPQEIQLTPTPPPNEEHDTEDIDIDHTPSPQPLAPLP
ncbi:MAG: hypothetical protein J3R72DRAFT_361527, partial [Linnemannia gamsii]